MKIDCISDLHGARPKLEGGDLLIVAGDLTAQHTKKEHVEFTEWYLDQPYRKKVLIAGNHDTAIESGDYYFDHDWLGYLQDSGTEFEGLRIWGSPWTHKFPGMNRNCAAFTIGMYESMKPKWDLIPDDIDILVTHCPPYGTFDSVGVEYGARTGCMDLRDASQDRIKPRLHVFGHIHEHGGKRLDYKRPGHGTENNTIYVNASIMDERYRPVHKPVTIIL